MNILSLTVSKTAFPYFRTAFLRVPFSIFTAAALSSTHCCFLSFIKFPTVNSFAASSTTGNTIYERHLHQKAVLAKLAATKQATNQIMVETKTEIIKDDPILDSGYLKHSLHEGYEMKVAAKATKKPTYPWCCTASLVDEQSSNNVQIQTISGYEQDGFNNNNNHEVEIVLQEDSSSFTLDLTTSPDWMEFVERSENRMNDEGGAGAYDTLRCDYVLSLNNNGNGSTKKMEDSNGKMLSQDISENDFNCIQKDHWKIWGLDYHLKRLQKSFRSLVDEQIYNQNQNIKINGDGLKPKKLCHIDNLDKAIVTATQESKRIFDALLQAAEQASILNEQTTGTQNDDLTIQLIRVTFLWSSPRKHDDDRQKIIVRGHACSSAKAVPVHGRPVQPIVCTIAAEGHHHPRNKGGKVNEDGSVADVVEDKSLPTRHRDPENKVASWTRLRKAMESPTTYKPPGVSEVLMIRPHKESGDLEVLEGLSSNFFAVYNDGTLRTAHDGVLNGYVRHLVLDCADQCGLKVEEVPKPILLQDAEKGLWKEAFITSSSRLIFPISKILMHDFDNGNGSKHNQADEGGDRSEPAFVDFWSDPVLTNSHDIPNSEKPKWQQLLDEILRRGGYPCL